MQTTITKIKDKTKEVSMVNARAFQTLRLWRVKAGKKLSKWNDVGTIRGWRDKRS